MSRFFVEDSSEGVLAKTFERKLYLTFGLFTESNNEASVSRHDVAHMMTLASMMNIESVLSRIYSFPLS
ncbi:hypothetical protein L917_05566 [Phytophthora nicotianae]|uniref:Uncharacterized protein n=1 Tax=Phytophthora nicotianae TaxID=4792 RepID=W2LK47_PHYNI|nr:hypothetical protein L917_05566 [Phytophthora nicotianae]